MPDRLGLSFTQIQAAMQAMIEKAMQLPEEPVAMAIVDATGNLLAYNTMDNLRLFSRRHALRKAYTAAILGLDTGAHGPVSCHHITHVWGASSVHQDDDRRDFFCGTPASSG